MFAKLTAISPLQGNDFSCDQNTVAVILYGRFCEYFCCILYKKAYLTATFLQSKHARKKYIRCHINFVGRALISKWYPTTTPGLRFPEHALPGCCDELDGKHAAPIQRLVRSSMMCNTAGCSANTSTKCSTGSRREHSSLRNRELKLKICKILWTVQNEQMEKKKGIQWNLNYRKSLSSNFSFSFPII